MAKIEVFWKVRPTNTDTFETTKLKKKKTMNVIRGPN